MIDVRVKCRAYCDKCNKTQAIPNRRSFDGSAEYYEDSYRECDYDDNPFEKALAALGWRVTDQETVCPKCKAG